MRSAVQHLQRRRSTCQALLIFLVLPAALSAQSFVPPLHAPEMRYRIDVRVDTGAHRIDGTGSVTLKNVGRRALSALRFRWFAWRSGSYTITLAGKQHSSSATVLDIALPMPLAPGASVTVPFQFTRALGNVDAGFGIQRWFPYLWWGYDTHASYDVAISAPGDLIVGATGRRDASGRYRADHAGTFGMYFARGFNVAELAAGATLVRSIFRPNMRECAALVLATAADAVNYYRQRLGSYPQSSLTIIPGGSEPAGGYPYATAMVVVHGQEACATKPRDTHWRWIASHEVGHQYWLEQVLPKETEQGWGWLMIGLGIWLDREYARARGFTGGQPGLLDAYADAVRKDLNTTIEIAPDELRKLKFDYNTAVTHGKGFGIISGLANLLGHDTFDRVAKRALREYGGRRMGTDEFRRIAEAESEQDLGWYFTPFLRTNQFASYEIIDTLKSASGVHVRVVASGAIRLPVPVEARFANGERRRAVLDRTLDDQTVEFANIAALTEFVVDPDRDFPLVNPPPDINVVRLAQLVDELPWTTVGDRAVRLYRRANELDAKDAIVWRKLGLTLFDGGHVEESLASFERLIPLIANNPTMVHWQFGALVWRGMLNDLLGHRDVALASYQRALALGGEPALRHDQFGLVINRQFAEQRLQVPFTWR